MTQDPAQQRKMEDCRKVCHHCSLTCLQALRFLLNDTKESVDHHIMLTLQVCADMCALSAKTLALGSELHEYTCAACAGLSRACANEMDRLEPTELIRNCAEECLRCAEACEEMAPQERRHKKYEEGRFASH